ncbi:Ankyrin repeat and SAM domain-containing protein 3 [Colletotrichum siamense]|uniref:Ankyrin repeat and SAM domain-containing protein 3 n=1 Tax=Colletotrichum siamense TaxID=690259 RepID=UPI001872A913|nr:Ankyrin repeat and SAM domain-containing protein 3 [Colletotrichum siamense]KAF5492103.1 Ankyrin repeat and SAM domain-containing protein 3 [Colletotrichum siamense]
MFLSPYCSLIALCLSGGVAADGWDDFTNNLASDLAPIISLFGEQATKQYLSESITWLDYFIFAMAPIGILTALVSAIRVCGSPSLKAFIGRAKEAAGNVEAELLSSTSRNVCELYNGGGIERIIGRPKILEVVLDRKVDDEEFTREGGSAGIYTFADYVRNENHRQEWRPWPHHESTEPSKGDGPKMTEEYGPNLSHNVSIKRLDDWWFRLVGVIGFVLQVGVLIYAATATYYLRLEKDGEQPPSYACPMVIVGTVLVCGGVFFCAVLVGESTEEEIYQRERNLSERSSLYWLQPAQVHGDQTFEPFCYADVGGVGSLNRHITSRKKQSAPSELSVWLVVGSSVSGFVLQFVGLRGTHSSISLAQLGAALIMSMLRAGLRTQRLDSQGNRLSEQEISAMMISSDTLKGHELDWLALHIGQEEAREGMDCRASSIEKGGRTWRLCGLDIPWPREKDIEKASRPGETNSKRRSYSWLFFGATTAGERITYQPSETNSGGIGHKPSESAEPQGRADCANRILAYRRTLTRLTEPTTAKLDLAVLTRHFSNEMVAVRETARQLVLAIESVANSVCSSSTAIIMEEWRSKHNDLYCAMNCGVSPRAGNQIAKVLLHLHRGGQDSHWRLEGKEIMEAMLGLWTWSLISESARSHSQLKVTRRRIVSSVKHPEEVGYYKWFRSAAGRPMKHTLKGLNTEFGPSTLWLNEEGKLRNATPTPTGNSEISKGPLNQLFGWFSGEPLHLSSSSEQSEIDVFTLPTTSDLLSLCAQEILGTFVKSILDLVKSIGEVEVDGTADNVCLRSRLASELVEAIEKSGLASRDDALLCVLPPIVRREFDAQRTPLWFAAGIGHEGMVIEALGQITDRHGYNLPSLAGPLLQAASKGRDGIVRLLLQHGADPNVADASGTTPLCQASENGHEQVVRVLLEFGEVNPNVTDPCGRTPLWHAANNGHELVVMALLEQGARPEKGASAHGTPLQRAIHNGHDLVVREFHAHSEGKEMGYIGGGRNWVNDEMMEGPAEQYEKACKSFLDYVSPNKFEDGKELDDKDAIKIALLGQGVDSEKLRTHGSGLDQYIFDKQNFTNESPSGKGLRWEATLISLIHQYGPKAKIYVAQVTNERRVHPRDADQIVEAIEYAIESWNVDIIVLPFGFASVNRMMMKPLAETRKMNKQTIVIAAATTNGFNSVRGYPATSPHVIAIHAVDGQGRHCGLAPSPKAGDYNFSVVGAGLKAPWTNKETGKKLVNGNTYTAGIAAGIAASFLHFLRISLIQDEPKLNLSPEDHMWLRSTDGMREMLHLMSTPIDGYNFLTPWAVFSKNIKNSKNVENSKSVENSKNVENSKRERILDIIKMTVDKKRGRVLRMPEPSAESSRSSSCD